MFKHMHYLSLEVKIALKRMYHECAHGPKWVGENKLTELQRIAKVTEYLESLVTEYHRKYGEE